jgi:hypothetical protein
MLRAVNMEVPLIALAVRPLTLKVLDVPQKVYIHMLADKLQALPQDTQRHSLMV